MRKLLAYAAIYFLWGASFLAIREVVAMVPPFFAAAFRFLCAGMVLFTFSLWRGMPRPNRRQLRSTALLGLVMFAGDYGCLFWAEKEVPSGLAAVIAATIPVWVLLAEWLFAGSQRPTARSLTGIVLGIGGVIVLMIPSGLNNAAFSISALVLLTGCLFWSGGTVASRYLQLPRQLSMSSGLQMTFGGAFLLVMSAASGELHSLPVLVQRWNWQLVWAMSYLIVFASIIAFTAYVWLIAREPTTRVASYAYVNPLIALLLGALLAHERPSPLQYAGAALVVAGVAFTIAGKRVAKREPAEQAA
ncbi:MAG TPA: EamA family transporter [Acidobacteriaceae bacterium]|nr:EamA family transporter [Acidobacteriaceae bacterium]